MQEEPKRLQPLPDVLRRLFLHSGNMCSFPGCSHLMMDCNGVFIGQLCHIEAAEKGGERFNPEMTNEDRRAESNLMLMCYPHHRVTNDVIKYSVDKLSQMKRQHEARFSSPDRAIREKLIDWTTRELPKSPLNLKRLSTALKLDLDDEQEAEMLKGIESYISLLKVAPIDARRFLQALAVRIRRVRKTNAVVRIDGALAISPEDIESAFSLSQQDVKKKIDALERYQLGDIYENDPWGANPYMIRIYSVDGWPIAEDIVRFCEREDLDTSTFFEDIDFQSFASSN